MGKRQSKRTWLGIVVTHVRGDDGRVIVDKFPVSKLREQDGQGRQIQVAGAVVMLVTEGFVHQDHVEASAQLIELGFAQHARVGGIEQSGFVRRGEGVEQGFLRQDITVPVTVRCRGRQASVLPGLRPESPFGHGTDYM